MTIFECGILKPVIQRVGSGPLPTEDFGALGEKYQSVGREFGKYLVNFSISYALG